MNACCAKLSRVKCLCASPVRTELLGKRVVLFSPVDIVDPFWSRFGRLPYSPAVHAALGSGLVHPMVRACCWLLGMV